MLLPLQTNSQLDGAFELLKKLGPETLDTAALNAAAGVGMVVRTWFLVCSA